MEANKKRKKESGQAMTEFIILLFIILTLSAGMIYVTRLLTFEYWAGQETRFIAFERAWVPKLAGTTPVLDVSGEAPGLRRPTLLNTMEPGRGVEGITSLDNFLEGEDSFDPPDFIDPVQEDPGPVIPPAVPGAGGSFFSKRQEPSMWKSKTTEWLASLIYRAEHGMFALVSSAFASHDRVHRRKLGSTMAPDRIEKPSDPNALFVGIRGGLDRKLTQLLDAVEFGEGLCQRMESFLQRHNVPKGATEFSSSDCPGKYDRALGVQMAHNLDYREIFGEFGHELEYGLETREALEVTLEKVVATEFYSLFDERVRDAFEDALPFLEETYSELEPDGREWIPDYRFLTDWYAQARHVGTNFILDRLALIIDVIFDTYQTGPLERQTVASVEELVASILNTDITYPGDPLYNEFDFAQPFSFWSAELPASESYLPMMGDLFEGAMRNILSQEPGLQEELIDVPVEFTRVSYPAWRGLFPAAKRRWPLAQDLQIDSDMILITQPWHMMRMLPNDLPNFREVGNFDDDLSDTTEEAVLRRRILGLYIYPAEVDSFLSPVTTMLPQLAPIIDDYRLSIDALTPIKEFTDVHPLEQFNSWPFFELSFGETYLPVARPQVYPHSTELENDVLTGEARDFAAYVEEQIEYNPPADPEYAD